MTGERARLPTLFGYAIDSDVPLVRCRPAPAPRGTLRVRCVEHDLLAREGELISWDERDGAQFALAASGRDVLVWCSVTGAYALDGREGRVEAQPRGATVHWEHRLTATVLPLLLAERGDLALHAAAIDTEDGAVIFCGPTGAGKSTLAAALSVRGRTILSEDGVVISGLTLTAANAENSGGALVWPGADGVRIPPATLRRLDRSVPAPHAGQARPRPSLGAAPETDPAPADPLGAAPSLVDRTKVTQLCTGNPVGPRPLRAVALLAARGQTAPQLEQLDPLDALPALVPQALFRGNGGLAAAMAGCAALASRYPVYSVTMPDQLAHAGDHAAALIEMLCRR